MVNTVGKASNVILFTVKLRVLSVNLEYDVANPDDYFSATRKQEKDSLSTSQTLA